MNHHESIIKSNLAPEGILTLTFNSPRNRNALSKAMLEALQSQIQAASESIEVRVIVIDAIGSAFCAGHDLKEIESHRGDADDGVKFFQELMSLCSAVMEEIVRSPKPVIAKVDGIATAAGCQLVATCDLAYASEQSRFSTPGVHIGLFCSTPMVALSRNVSHKHAMEMLLVGEMISSVRAEEIGLINRCTKVEELDHVVALIALKITSKSVQTLRIGKQAFYEQVEMTLPEAYKYASEVMVSNLIHQDAREGIAAFLEKRDPKWENKSDDAPKPL